MRTHFFRRTLYNTLCLMAVAGLAMAVGCAPRPHMNASQDLVSVRVLPAKAPVWTYTITTRNVENLLEVEFVSDSDLSNVEVVSIPAVYELEKTYDGNSIRVALKGHLFRGRGVFQGGQFRSMQLMLKSKDKEIKNGDIQVRVTDFRGNITTIDKIAGPV